MRQFQRIIGFVAVSFVLVFIAKVNKVGLYDAYFKTIADVEVRNSTALDHSDTQFAAVSVSPKEVRQLEQRAAGAALLLLGIVVHAPAPVHHDLAWNAPQPDRLAMRCFMEVAPRAPGA